MKSAICILTAVKKNEHSRKSKVFPEKHEICHLINIRKKLKFEKSKNFTCDKCDNFFDFRKKNTCKI